MAARPPPRSTGLPCTPSPDRDVSPVHDQKVLPIPRSGGRTFARVDRGRARARLRTVRVGVVHAVLAATLPDRYEYEYGHAQSWSPRPVRAHEPSATPCSALRYGYGRAAGPAAAAGRHSPPGARQWSWASRGPEVCRPGYVRRSVFVKAAFEEPGTASGDPRTPPRPATRRGRARRCPFVPCDPRCTSRRAPPPGTEDGRGIDPSAPHGRERRPRR